MPTPFPTFSSTEGRRAIRGVIKTKLGLDPHDFQLECVCKLLDGTDVFAIAATGDGKSGLFSMYAISINTELQPPGAATRFPLNPVLLVICPTKSLEEDMAEFIQKLGLKTLAINTDALSDAGPKGKDSLRLEARNRAALVFLAPEQLNTKAFWQCLEDPVFQVRALGTAIDEVHILLTWGAKFRKAFSEIGLLRARMRSSTTILAVTATMKSGAPLRDVYRSLGLRDGNFFLLRRSNMRPNIQQVVRVMHSGIAGAEFPEFLHILYKKRKTIISCSTIALSVGVMTYLWRSLTGPSAAREKRLRMYNSLNWPEFNRKTRALMDLPNTGLIVIATDTLAVGFDRPDIEDVANGVCLPLGIAARASCEKMFDSGRMVPSARNLLPVLVL
ncbi:hypothetical protein FA95DRAFT_1505665 [Auriscalpium vulgare]|uniref:Uncharacterized protein n=1 Tax=Auriscalpium vulgare TaxID=40419 RepID=A0ACB8R3S1_9AGAM|nr:hypothetical protein FA95DRAFT_1505665 [Auriscalpium vulgare]